MNPADLSHRIHRVASMVTLATAIAFPATGAQAANAGIARFEVPYAGTRIDAVVHYPTDAAERRIEAGPFVLQAAPGAPMQPGRHPLVLISHGTGGMNLNHHLVAEALARAGFVVAAPTHPGDNFRDRSMMADPRYFVERPRQLSIVLDALLASARWGASIDPGRIGAAGHSAGGYAVAALAGAEPDRARLAAHCAADTPDPACRYRDPSVGVSDPVATPFVMPEASRVDQDVRDARVRAALLMAPLGAVIAPGSLHGIGVRIRLLGAEFDEVLGREWHYDAIAAELPAGAATLAPGAGHFAFVSPPAPAWAQRFGPVAADPEGFDRAAFQQRLAGQAVQFFQQALPAR